MPVKKKGACNYKIKAAWLTFPPDPFIQWSDIGKSLKLIREIAKFAKNLFDIKINYGWYQKITTSPDININIYYASLTRRGIKDGNSGLSGKWSF